MKDALWVGKQVAGLPRAMWADARQVGEEVDRLVQQVWNGTHGGVPMVPREVQLEADKLQSAFYPEPVSYKTSIICIDFRHFQKWPISLLATGQGWNCLRAANPSVA